MTDLQVKIERLDALRRQYYIQERTDAQFATSGRMGDLLDRMRKLEDEIEAETQGRAAC